MKGKDSKQVFVKSSEGKIIKATVLETKNFPSHEMYKAEAGVYVVVILNLSEPEGRNRTK